MSRILVLGSDRSRGALAGIRALGSRGWDVGVGSPTPGGPGRRSRFARRWHEVPLPGTDDNAFAKALGAAIEAADYDVVVAGGDDWLLALAACAPSLASTVAHPPLTTVLRAIDKLSLAEAATAAGLATPLTAPGSRDGMANWRGPAVVKPRLHWQPGRPPLPRVEATIATGADIARAVRAIEAVGGEPVLQEPIVGRLEALAGVFIGGEFRARVQQVAHRVHPAMGISSRASTVAVDESLADGVARLLRSLGWFGLAQIQFLRGADGIPRVIDLNGRFYGSMALATSAGVNLPDVLGRAALGLPTDRASDARPGVRYVRLEGEARRVLEARSLREAAGTLGFSLGATQALWSRRDPMPVVGALSERIRRRLDR